MLYHYKAYWLLILAGFVMLLIVLPTSQADACTPTPVGRPALTIAERVAAADLVLEGTVTSLDNSSPNEPAAVVTVNRYFKGSDAGIVTIHDFGSSSLCRRFVEVGEHLIFYTLRNSDGSLHAYWQTAGGAVMAVNASTIQEIMDVLPATPVMASPSPTITPSPTPMPTNAPSFFSSQFTQSMIGISLVIVLILIGEWATRK